MDARGLRTCALLAPITLARVLLATHGAAAGDRIDAVLTRALVVARESHARVYEPPIHRELAALARLRGDDVTAAREQAEADRILATRRSETSGRRRDRSVAPAASDARNASSAASSTATRSPTRKFVGETD